MQTLLQHVATADHKLWPGIKVLQSFLSLQYQLYPVKITWNEQK